jgi:hypothetical protein
MFGQLLYSPGMCPISYTRSNKRARILELLKARSPQWVPIPELVVISVQYSARIFELRHAGHHIENRTEWKDGVRHGFFRWLPKSKPRPEIAVPAPSKDSQAALFNSDPPAWHDPEEQAVRR